MWSHFLSLWSNNKNVSLGSVLTCCNLAHFKIFQTGHVCPFEEVQKYYHFQNGLNGILSKARRRFSTPNSKHHLWQFICHLGSKRQKHSIKEREERGGERGAPNPELKHRDRLETSHWRGRLQTREARETPERLVHQPSKSWSRERQPVTDILTVFSACSRETLIPMTCTT